MRRTFYVQAPTAAARDEWISAIQSMLNEDRESRDSEVQRFQKDVLGGKATIAWSRFAASLRAVLDGFDDDDEDALHFVLHSLADDAGQSTSQVSAQQVIADFFPFSFLFFLFFLSFFLFFSFLFFLFFLSFFLFFLFFLFFRYLLFICLLTQHHNDLFCC